MTAQVVEYQGYARTCSCCGEVTHAAIPADVRAYSIGTRLAALLAYLVGAHRVSRRGIEEIVEAVFDVPVSLGTVCHLETGGIAKALAPAVPRPCKRCTRRPAKHVDETGWKKAGKRKAGGRAWLWVAATATAAVFVIHARRSLAGLQTLLGEVVSGVLITTDHFRSTAAGRRTPATGLFGAFATRFPGHDRPRQRRRLRGQRIASGCGDLLFFTGSIASATGRCSGGRCRTRAGWLFREDVRADRPGTRRVCGCAPRRRRSAGNCWRWKRRCGRSWNTRESSRRTTWPSGCCDRRCCGVRDRFGCQSETGCRFVERMLTVVQTLRLQRRSVLAYLEETLSAHRNGLPAPSLLAAD